MADRLRYLKRHLQGKEKGSQSIEDGEISITFRAREWIDSFLTKDMAVFEWGSGGSTVFLSKRVRKLVSVEHDRYWYGRVLEKIRENSITNCTLLLVEPEAVTRRADPSDPKGYVSSDPRYNNMSFETYVKIIEQFSETFDLVFIDGRARPSCIYHALNKVRCGGFIMLDDSERHEYQRGMKLLRGWKQTDFFDSRLIGRTTIWEKPIRS